MEGGSGPATGERGSNRGLLWGLVVAILLLAAVVVGCSGDEAVIVPDLVGLEETEARNVLSDADLELGEVERLVVETDTAETGTVLSQLPSDGSEVDAGSEVALVVAEESEGGTAGEGEAETSPVDSGVGSGSGGGSQDEIVLGSGDAQEGFQTFELPRTPFTYPPDEGATPPQAPEPTIYVGGRAWTRVESLSEGSPNDEIYVLRVDPDGSVHVRFGDGETGAQPASGVEISAVYRTSADTSSPTESSSTPSAGARTD